jgi:hypothetical protein
MAESKQLSGYSLSKEWFDFCFENSGKIAPIHTALYFFCIENCNRLGWKDKFGLPCQMAMEAIGVKNWRTYDKAFNDLVDWGFIEVIEKSKNQYTATVIAIVKNTKANTVANTKALTKAIQKHVQEQEQKQYKGIAHIDKLLNLITNKLINHTTGDFDFSSFDVIDLEKTLGIKQPTTEIDIGIDESNQGEETNEGYSFEFVWNLYDKKVGDKKKLIKKWDALSKASKDKILEYIPRYIDSQPDKQYRKNFETFLNNSSWEDEIIGNNNGGTKAESDIREASNEVQRNYNESF